MQVFSLTLWLELSPVLLVACSIDTEVKTSASLLSSLETCTGSFTVLPLSSVSLKSLLES